MGEGLAADRRRAHLERRDADRLGRGDALGKPVDPPLVHQEADRAAVHAEHRPWRAALEHSVHRLQHEAVAAERDQGLGLVGAAKRSAAKQRLGGLRDLGR